MDFVDAAHSASDLNLASPALPLQCYHSFLLCPHAFLGLALWVVRSLFFVHNMHCCSEVTSIFLQGWSAWELLMNPATVVQKKKNTVNTHLAVLGQQFHICTHTRTRTHIMLCVLYMHLSFVLSESQSTSSLGPAWFPKSANIDRRTVASFFFFWLEVVIFYKFLEVYKFYVLISVCGLC